MIFVIMVVGRSDPIVGSKSFLVNEMKSYEEMIQWHVDQVDSGKLRHYEWPSALAISEVFGKDSSLVLVDIDSEKAHRESIKKQQRKELHRAENEKRRLANLQKAQNVE